ncbi:MAG: DUF3857 domain-containing protein, partial [Desulfobacteraceae bacterium]|nr:DUF3857 domain-containing protein [Desulfobacteraceae bacterium]
FVDVREVNIVRGEERIPVDVALIHELPAPQSGIYWNAAIKTLQLPRLRVNDGIELRVFRKGYSYALLDGEGAVPGTSGLPAGTHTAGASQSTSTGRGLLAEPDDDKYIPPMPGEYFDIVLFQSSVPIIEKRYELTLPADKRLHSETYNGPLYASTTYSEDTTTYTWWIEDVPAVAREPRSPDMSDRVPKVVVATVESWEAKSRWFFDVNKNQFDVTPEIQAKVDEVLRDAGVARGSEEEKAEVLVHWVAQNIRYSGQTMGEGEGYTLHSGAMIFEQRSGVCKDIAGMLVTMMRAAGMNSYAAMTMAGSRIEQVPADQFNHCVVALRKDDGSFEMYDPTWVSYYRDIWSKYEAEQDYLIGTPDGETLSRIPYSPPEESALRVTSTGKILPDGSFEGTIKMHGDGAMDSRLRRILSRNRILDIENYLADLLHHVSDRVELISYEHGGLLDFKKSMWWEISYRIPEFAMLVDGGYEFKSPMMHLINYSLFRQATYNWPEKRRDDVFFYATQLIDGTETIKLPMGYRVTESKESNEIDETYAYFKGGSEMTKKGFIVKQRAEIKRRQIRMDGYSGFRKAMKEAKKYTKTIFRAEKGGAK